MLFLNVINYKKSKSIFIKKLDSKLFLIFLMKIKSIKVLIMNLFTSNNILRTEEISANYYREH